MGRDVAVIGAGPSGLAAGKAALECGLRPTIFETSHKAGGLWRCGDGLVWRGMRTNLSKWMCSFSDYPWAEAADEFPLASEVEDYLQAYATHFGVGDHIAFGERVTSIDFGSGAGKVSITGPSMPPRQFDGILCASGIFARPFTPPLPGMADFKGRSCHSGEYRCATEFEGKRVAVIGASLTGVEISAHLAEHGIGTVLFFGRPVWILPRYTPAGAGEKTVPVDLILYRRGSLVSADAAPGAQARYLAIAKYFQQMFGNPGDVHEALRAPVDGTPPHVAISDTFLGHVASGAIIPVPERVSSLRADSVVTTAGRSVFVDAIIFCTGYETDLSFLPPAAKAIIDYDASDKLVSHIAYLTVMHPELQSIFFVGQYRSPYFGVIELQARWAAMVLAGELPRPAPFAVKAGLKTEHAIRALRPRPQFPHSDYVLFADSIARELGVHPEGVERSALQKAMNEGPVIPAQYRLRGPRANPEIAAGTVLSACRRAGLKV
jgi:dimethylaniline monooxygenase (N-oxide forming)